MRESYDDFLAKLPKSAYVPEECTECGAPAYAPDCCETGRKRALKRSLIAHRVNRAYTRANTWHSAIEFVIRAASRMNSGKDPKAYVSANGGKIRDEMREGIVKACELAELVPEFATDGEDPNWVEVRFTRK